LHIALSHVKFTLGTCSVIRNGKNPKQRKDFLELSLGLNPLYIFTHYTAKESSKIKIQLKQQKTKMPPLNANAEPFEMLFAPEELSKQDLYELECLDDWVELQAELNVVEMEMLRQLILHQQHNSYHTSTPSSVVFGAGHSKPFPTKVKTNNPRRQQQQQRRATKHGYGKKQGFPIFQPN
jgi:hypothetical protein